jgi:hypothetical protein
LKEVAPMRGLAPGGERLIGDCQAVVARTNIPGPFSRENSHWQ